MADTNSHIILEINNPIDAAKKTIEEIFEENKKRLIKMSFMSTYSIKNKTDEYILPKQSKFLFSRWNKIYMVEFKKEKIIFSLKSNFTVIDVKECTLIYNDRSGKKPIKYYLATLIHADGKIAKDVEITNNAKSDYKQFQSYLNSQYNGFVVNMTESEYKTFMAEYITPKDANNVLIYTNAGVLEESKILYENALATRDGIIWADENGYIKIDEKTYIKLAESVHYLPKLFKSKKTGQKIANEFMTNVKECWSENIISAILTLGHMVMSIYFEDFTKRYGVPTLILFGETGTGKSTLVTVGLSIFGMSKDALSSGGSTTRSNEYFGSKYNGMIIGIDDVKGQTLNSASFASLVQAAYKGIVRNRMLPYGKGPEYIKLCSALAYSTNESLPYLREIINRLNVIEIFGKVFKADKFKYHEFNKENNDNLKELSLILPEFLKIPKNEVIEIYEESFNLLESNVEDTQCRVISNIAYAYTGALMLSKISGVEFDNLSGLIIDFTRNQVEKYENIKTPVDQVLSLIPALYLLGIIEKDKHFSLSKPERFGKLMLELRFKKDVILSAINKYYSHDKKKQIDETTFLSYAKNHKRYLGTKTARYKFPSSNDMAIHHSMVFDVSGMAEYADFGSLEETNPMSFDDLGKSIEEQKSNKR